VPFITVGGRRIRYERWTARDGAATGRPPLVIVPGLTAAAGEWVALARAARARGPVIIPDLLGPGAGRPPAATTIATLSDALAGLLDALGVARACLLGHALGGIVTLHCTLYHPQRVAALVLASTTPAAPDPWEREQLRALLASGSGPAPPLPPPSGTLLPARQDADVAREAPERAGAAHALLTRPDLTPFLMEVRAPTLVLVGERAPAPLQRGAELLHGWIPTSRLVRVPRAGHQLHLDAPAAVARLVVSFLQEAAGDAATNGSEVT
jgi:pimeloyl-ACP methyl ester carboxylesterase